MDEWQIEQLDGSHERGAFHCGKAPLDEFIRAQAGQYERRRFGRTYVAVRPGEKRVYGYHTLAAGAVPIQNLPPKAAKKLPKHPVPVAVLGRLAVDQSAQGHGLGAALLKDALRRCLSLSDSLAIYAVVVHAIDDEAKQFYMKYGFLTLLDNEKHLHLPLKTLEGSGDEA
jgi:GNAT superfamily N-acetyltransferase